MKQGISLVVYPVKDLARAKSLYRTLLGVEPYLELPYYVGFRIGDQEIGLDPNGYNKGVTEPIAYWEVANIRERLQTLLDAGASLGQEVTDVGGGKLVATVKDADGHILGLVQNPPGA